MIVSYAEWLTSRGYVIRDWDVFTVWIERHARRTMDRLAHVRG